MKPQATTRKKVCPICKKQQNQKHMLRHMLMCDGMVFVCRIDGCGAIITPLDSLHRHAIVKHQGMVYFGMGQIQDMPDTDNDLRHKQMKTNRNLREVVSSHLVGEEAAEFAVRRQNMLDTYGMDIVSSIQQDEIKLAEPNLHPTEDNLPLASALQTELMRKRSEKYKNGLAHKEHRHVTSGHVKKKGAARGTHPTTSKHSPTNGRKSNTSPIRKSQRNKMKLRPSLGLMDESSDESDGEGSADGDEARESTAHKPSERQLRSGQRSGKTQSRESSVRTNARTTRTSTNTGTDDGGIGQIAKRPSHTLRHLRMGRQTRRKRKLPDADSSDGRAEDNIVEDSRLAVESANTQETSLARTAQKPSKKRSKVVSRKQMGTCADSSAESGAEHQGTPERQNVPVVELSPASQSVIHRTYDRIYSHMATANTSDHTFSDMEKALNPTNTPDSIMGSPAPKPQNTHLSRFRSGQESLSTSHQRSATTPNPNAMGNCTPSPQSASAIADICHRVAMGDISPVGTNAMSPVLNRQQEHAAGASVCSQHESVFLEPRLLSSEGRSSESSEYASTGDFSTDTDPMDFDDCSRPMTVNTRLSTAGTPVVLGDNAHALHELLQPNEQLELERLYQMHASDSPNLHSSEHTVEAPAGDETLVTQDCTGVGADAVPMCSADISLEAPAQQPAQPDFQVLAEQQGCAHAQGADDLDSSQIAEADKSLADPTSGYTVIVRSQSPLIDTGNENASTDTDDTDSSCSHRLVIDTEPTEPESKDSTGVGSEAALERSAQIGVEEAAQQLHEMQVPQAVQPYFAHVPCAHDGDSCSAQCAGRVKAEMQDSTGVGSEAALERSAQISRETPAQQQSEKQVPQAETQGFVHVRGDCDMAQIEGSEYQKSRKRVASLKHELKGYATDDGTYVEEMKAIRKACTAFAAYEYDNPNSMVHVVDYGDSKGKGLHNNVAVRRGTPLFTYGGEPKRRDVVDKKDQTIEEADPTRGRKNINVSVRDKNNKIVQLVIDGDVPNKFFGQYANHNASMPINVRWMLVPGKNDLWNIEDVESMVLVFYAACNMQAHTELLWHYNIQNPHRYAIDYHWYKMGNAEQSKPKKSKGSRGKCVVPSVGNKEHGAQATCSGYTTT